MITVFGLGFVGLTTALGFANFGNKVYGIDKDKERLEMLSSNKLPFFEPGLDLALEKHNGSNFIITEDVKMAISNSEFLFFCVGTPYGESGQANLEYLFSAIKTSVDNMDGKSKKIMVIKSTVPPSTTKYKVIPFIESLGLKVGEDVFLANNPEFLREGSCWEDFINADRIVIGCEDSKTSERLSHIYSPFDCPIHKVSYNSGEFVKYLSNTMLATMISYSNEMSIIADAIGEIDIASSFRILHDDKRWGNGNMSSYVYPGCGYGGYCLPKDTNALYSVAKENNTNPKILKNVIKINEDMPHVIANRIMKNVSLDENIGILGLSFKPNSDDVRDSTSAKIMEILISEGYRNIQAYDPIANKEFKKTYDFDIKYMDSLNSICESADTLIILTAWKEFLDIKNVTSKKILDYRYIL